MKRREITIQEFAEALGLEYVEVREAQEADYDAPGIGEEVFRHPDGRLFSIGILTEDLTGAYQGTEFSEYTP